MNNEYAVEFRNVSKLYNLKNKAKDCNQQRFYALKDISFTIKKGEIVGFLGTNGSGKSTLFKMLSGLSEPSKGEVITNGVTSLIAIKSGLKKQLTGLENIELKGALLGLSKKQIQESINSIVEFSELGDFIHQPVKSYSSGMKSRLGFSISVSMDPDIILIDEALSVGDAAFNSKCFNKIKELQQSGKTILFVSHSINEIKKICTSAIWIESGKLVSVGDINHVIKEYSNYMDDLKSKSNKDREQIRKEKFEERIILKTIDKKKRKKKFVIKFIKFTSIFFIIIPILLILFMKAMH